MFFCYCYSFKNVPCSETTGFKCVQIIKARKYTVYYYKIPHGYKCLKFSHRKVYKGGHGGNERQSFTIRVYLLVLSKKTYYLIPCIVGRQTHHLKIR